MIEYIKQIFLMEIIFKLIIILVSDKYKEITQVIFRLVIVLYLVSVLLRIKDYKPQHFLEFFSQIVTDNEYSSEISIKTKGIEDELVNTCIYLKVKEIAAVYMIDVKEVYVTFDTGDDNDINVLSVLIDINNLSNIQGDSIQKFKQDVSINFEIDISNVIIKGE